jgi:hypothetical protein
MVSPGPRGLAAGTGEYVQIPKKYGDKKTSPLKVELTKGKNTKDLELTD